jgi:predicted transcriptional regulator YdeE
MNNKNMDVKIIKIEADIMIAGFSIESTGENYNKDTELLYNDFIQGEKIKSLNNISKNDHEYYAVTWYGDELTDGEFLWLLGQKVNEKPDGFDTKIIRKGEYAVSKFPPKYHYDEIKAWTDFYGEGIPEIGYKAIEENNMAFVYYPNGLNGNNELWALVEKV